MRRNNEGGKKKENRFERVGQSFTTSQHLSFFCPLWKPIKKQGNRETETHDTGITWMVQVQVQGKEEEK